jgi:hypothetical protein
LEPAPADVLPSDAGLADAGPAAAPICPNGELVCANFSTAALGSYAEADVARDFGVEATWNNGLDEGQAEVAEEGENRFLRVRYPQGGVGPNDAGVQFEVSFGASFDELYFSYRLRFAEDFEFVKGGKLPGLVGGTSPTGCRPDPDGFSARNMWRPGGAIVQYIYYPDQPNACGNDRYYDIDGDDVSFVRGQWMTIVHRILMNTPGQNDGRLQGWVDGQLALDAARAWRLSDDFGVDALYFSTFFGGSDGSWAPGSEQTIDFDDLTVSESPL